MEMSTSHYKMGTAVQKNSACLCVHPPPKIPVNPAIINYWKFMVCFVKGIAIGICQLGVTVHAK